ncbi:uncharacterized protein PHALS_03570 [Plasmopara halstedii]|uniref:Uncharacterized protein n=1 Tax=Plasmopara halstedii TaxID=4781 RepID=A0A0P1AZ91_PLAHL|nr:uncharacterized protein PHALS_03570 [Plasmopara halstedii]CEG46896.1 hypothetical protein PHALS_03570 [Plasmopara halstedii]|eukprot:XP_024583265.1 hypothetical protein PHALS_03570 [Plasmopara halstedii]
MIVIYTWASSSRLYHSTKRKVSYNLTWAYTLTFRSLAEEQLVATMMRVAATSTEFGYHETATLEVRKYAFKVFYTS